MDERDRRACEKWRKKIELQRKLAKTIAQIVSIAVSCIATILFLRLFGLA